MALLFQSMVYVIKLSYILFLLYISKMFFTLLMLSKKLLSILCFTTDNNISVEFDLFCFVVKDFLMRTPFLRCNRNDDLYPFTLQSASQVTQPSVFAAITKDLWHHCLGHPSTNVLSSLRSSLRFPSSKHLSSICKSCVLGKLIKLPFSSSTSITHISFDIIHTNLWTSPIPSSSGHKYYILFLDDKTNFLWTYPLAKKS